MKFITTNFVQCAVQSCARSSDAFPLKYEDTQLVKRKVDFDPTFMANILVKLDWDAIVKVGQQLGNESIPQSKPEMAAPPAEEDEHLLKALHELLLETQIEEGKMVCRNCGHIYHIKNSIPNFLLPPHLA